MEPRSELQDSTKYVYALSHNENRVLIEDVELEELVDSESGDTQDASKNERVAESNPGRTSLEIVFTEIVYGKHRGNSACRIMMDFTIQSQTKFKVDYATLDCQVARPSLSTDVDSTSDHFQPSIAWAVPRMLDYENKTHPGVKATASATPETDVGGVFTVGGVAVTKQKTYTDEWGWEVYATFSSSDGQKATIKDLAKWRFMANGMQKDSQCHTFSVEALVHHSAEPFQVDFVLYANLLFGTSRRTIGLQKKVQTRKVFYPHESPVIFQ